MISHFTYRYPPEFWDDFLKRSSTFKGGTLWFYFNIIHDYFYKGESYDFVSKDVFFHRDDPMIFFQNISFFHRGTLWFSFKIFLIFFIGGTYDFISKYLFIFTGGTLWFISKISCFCKGTPYDFCQITLTNSDKMGQPGYRYFPWKIEKLKLRGGIYR